MPRKARNTRNIAIRKNWIVREKYALLISGLENKSKRPNISPIFTNGDPNTVPNPTSGEPSALDSAEIVISGRVVAKLTTVAPIITLGIASLAAINVEAFPNHSAPMITADIEITKTISSGI